MEKRQKEKEKEMGLAKKSDGSLTGNKPMTCGCKLNKTRYL